MSTKKKLQAVVSKYEKKIAPFLERNPFSKVQIIEDDIFVTNPWNDDSLYFFLEDWNEGLMIPVLNNVILPPRFTAVYHVSTKTMEFIGTLLSEDDVCTARKFAFRLDGRLYSCKFAESSKEVRVLAACSKFVKQSITDYRNLGLLREYLLSKINNRKERRAGESKKQPPLEILSQT